MLAKVSENKRMMLPSNKHDAKCNCCFELLNIMRERIGTAIPTKAIGPQNAVVKPVNTEEINIK